MKHNKIELLSDELNESTDRLFDALNIFADRDYLDLEDIENEDLIKIYYSLKDSEKYYRKALISRNLI
jgi:hypothetical protein